MNFEQQNVCKTQQKFTLFEAIQHQFTKHHLISASDITLVTQLLKVRNMTHLILTKALANVR